jgi:capsular exopolysaccharide synthesis family protein
MHILKALEKQEHELTAEGGSLGPLDDHLYMHHMPYSYTAEQIRKLRTHIFHMPDRPVPRIIMVTSALPGEGKSVIASNLAIAIAKGEDQQVLLVDCDLRKPSLHELFKYPHSKGVSEILQGKADISECLISTPIDKLTILPAAKEPPANPSELLESRKTGALIQNLAAREGDWFIVVDTSPIQATVDPKILSDVVDGIINGCPVPVHQVRPSLRWPWRRSQGEDHRHCAQRSGRTCGEDVHLRKYKYYKNYYNR